MDPYKSAGLFVFSAHAEVVPGVMCAAVSASGILRACGGSSSLAATTSFSSSYSPRMRR